VIQSIKDNYNSPDSCPYLCVPLKKYQEFFLDAFNGSEGFSKIALTVAWIATGIFAYPIFGLLAAIGVLSKALCCKAVDVLPRDRNSLEQVDAMVRFFSQLPGHSMAVGYGAYNDYESRGYLPQEYPPANQLWEKAESEANVLALRELTRNVAMDFIQQGNNIKIDCEHTKGGHYDPMQEGQVYARILRV
jgi:hypothetical protein